MVTYFPYAIGASILGIVALLAYSVGIDVSGAIGRVAAGFQNRLDRADMQIKPEDFVLVLLGVGAALWIVTVFILGSSPLIAAFMLPLSIALVFIVGTFFLKFKGDRRVNGFVEQLELVLRMLSGALRVGLGLRQAIILVTEEVPDPARREFMRVVGRTNIGLNIVDALDDLTKSMPSNEMVMFSRVVRVQQQTGGDLAKVLEKLAATIRDRRRVQRKMGALTAQGRFGAAIIGALPLLIGGFVLATQPEMAQSLEHTKPGWIALGLVAVLETLAIYSLNKILQFDV